MDTQHEVTDDAKFGEWIRRIDAILDRRLGLSHSDLPDLCYEDAFDAGLSPIDMVEEIRAASIEIAEALRGREGEYEPL